MWLRGVIVSRHDAQVGFCVPVGIGQDSLEGGFQSLLYRLRLDRGQVEGSQELEQ